MRQRSKNMKIAKILFGLFLTTALTFSVQAGKTGGGTGGTTGAFSFTYNMGTEANYHVYALAAPVSSVKTRPTGTLRLGNWWVKDLGPAIGTGTVSCPKPLVSTSVIGALYFADTLDIGGQAFLHPVVNVQIFTSSWYNGYASIQVIVPADGDGDDGGIQLYWGPRFTPFAADISADVWDVEPSTW